MSFKSDIKSKKEKLTQKKFSKGYTPPIVQVIDSSQDQYYRNHERIQKRSKSSGKNFNKKQSEEQIKPYQPKVLDLSRIKNAVVENKKLAEKIIYSLPDSDEGFNSLLVVQTADQQNAQVSSRDRSLFSYKIEGKEGIKFISESHMKGRINSQLKQIQTKQLRKAQKQQQALRRIMEGSSVSDQLQINDQKAKETKKSQKTQDQPVQRKRAARYFQEMQSDDQGGQDMVKCFRCYKKGHIAKNCIEEQPKMSCNFCQNQHHHSVCDSSPCFRCCLPGHISQDCQSKAIECRKCKKRGHKSEKCGVYLPLDYHNKSQDYIKDRFKKTDLKKLKCLKFCKNPNGHFNCFTYKSSEDPNLYPNGSNNKKSYYDRDDQRHYDQRHYQREDRRQYDRYRR